MLSISGGIEIASMADIPSRGSGLGSSSSFTVALLNALYAFNNQYVSKEILAKQTCEIEIERCGEPIGKQDQYAAAYGGLNLIRFHPDDSVSVDPVICSPDIIKRIDEEKVYLQAHGGMPIDCFYHIYGTRADGDRLIAEYEGESPADYPGDNSQYSISGYHYDVK
jgi:galactokinase/mevalonate kinase-like predicted kinase